MAATLTADSAFMTHTRAYALRNPHVDQRSIDDAKCCCILRPTETRRKGGMVMGKTRLGLGVAIAVAVLAAGEGRVSLAQDPDQEQMSRVPQAMRPDGAGPQLVCGTKDLDPETARLSEEYAQRRLAALGIDPSITESHVIPVYFHRIHAGDGTGGVVTGRQVAAQIKVLNDAWASTTFSFVLQATTDTNNSSWYTCTGGSCE